MKPTELPAFSDSFVRATALASLAVNLTTPALQNFKDKLEVLWIDHDLANGFTNLKREIKCEFQCGPNYVRVVRAEYLVEDGIVQFSKCLSRSSHCFINRSNGDVLKASSWKVRRKRIRAATSSARTRFGV